ncbi:DUF4381 family protein [Methylobacterium iners]|uniref:DUF4381 domain-containing protein n=1 Tax=Methylobacterium iners TaxID=418707 RepID=A0ABQ4RV77_9HYPH|nr:DUF4381 family protein [Methylobacterium iners]GJD93872.1 hypothetical protein OCOJLMKI_1070 [Methylobacterium iners]
MNPELAAALDNLRGLHLPADAGGALRGEVVLAIALGFAAALLVGLVRYLRLRARRTVRRAALRELAATRDLDPEARLVAQARLLRRLARTLAGDATADARGRDWAGLLDGLFRTEFFTKGAGRVLTDGLYRRETADPAAIDAELGRLFARIGARRHA